MTPFTEPIRPNDVEELIDFRVPNKETESMARMQCDGVAALYNILCKGSVAYLADEVGTGKTYQALGLAALTWSEKPSARILFVSPRQNLQEKWVEDYKRFFRSNYRRTQQMGDDRVTSVLFGYPVHRPVRFDNLRSWTPMIGMPERIAPFLRHTSFMRPVFVRSADLTGDMNELWRHWRERFMGWSLFDSTQPGNLSPDNASYKLNLAFAHSLNRKLAAEATNRKPYFDLAVIDEAQCLRHTCNQTNSVLHESLKGQVAKWLFMSATPAHGGPGDIHTTVNHYPGCGEILDPELADNLPELQQALRKFMVRRQRRYLAKDRADMVGKDEYRHHDKQRWAVEDKAMTPLRTLAMGLVQKGLVDVLASRNNRYRIGFLSSFESLQSSIRPAETAAGGQTEPDGDRPTDFHRDPTEAAPRQDERNAPDAGFIDELAASFQKQFDMPLPHAKVDSVVEGIAPLAFGSATEEGGRKFLIFTRRISTVHALRDRLLKRHRKAVEERIQRCWNVEQLDWSGKGARSEVADDVAEDAHDTESFDSESADDPLRRAMSRGHWLHRFRQTFRASGRNALFFEDGWLERLCRAGRVEPKDVAERFPDEIWKESWTHASRGGRQHRADRLRYLAVQGIRRRPDIFGLSKNDAKPWQVAYETCLHNHLAKAQPDAEPHKDRELFSWPTLWTKWDAAFAGNSCALPADNPACVKGESGRDKLCRRQVARTILGQTFRLTDTLLDLFYAAKAGGSSEKLAECFLDWLGSDDPGAIQIRNDCTQWLKHLRLVVDGCLDGGDRPWHELVHQRNESWPQLYQAMPAVGVTGGSGGNRSAIRQFRTPSLPRVIVCTDTLKEGVDLHLFCDHVMHYGVAWTSGDMEQRIGRVDRYFSQIGRRLEVDGPPPEVRLHVGYPHVVASLERGQVERVIHRQQEAEKLMDSPLAGTGDDEREIAPGSDHGVRRRQPVGQPYGELDFPALKSAGRAAPLDATDAEQHYRAWYAALCRKLKQLNWSIEGDGGMGDGPELARHATLVLQDRQHEIEWGFDAALQRYVVTLSSPPWSGDGVFSGGKRRRTVDGRHQGQRFVRLLVPTPDEGPDETAIATLIDTVSGNAPKATGDGKAFWGDACEYLSSDGVDWESDHKASLTVQRGQRAQRLAVYGYEGSVRAVSVVSATLDGLSHRGVWDSSPSHEDVREWILDENNKLPLGYLDLHDRDGLVFGIHALHGDLSTDARRRLLEEVGWRADAWEASLTGADRQ